VPTWQEPYQWPPGGEVRSNFDDDEIAEMCRLAKSSSVTLPLS